MPPTLSLGDVNKCSFKNRYFRTPKDGKSPETD
jgi:hypothetical protein